MAQQTIGVGTTANDGTGDSLRTAGGKINANFSEVYANAAAAQTTANTAVTNAAAAQATANTANTTANAALPSATAATTYAKILESINTQTASYTLVLSDGVNSVVEMNVASANNLTIPLNASVAFPVGTGIPITQLGAGQTTVVATGGVTLLSSGAKIKLTGQYSAGTLYKRATDTWVLVGDLA